MSIIKQYSYLLIFILGLSLVACSSNKEKLPAIPTDTTILVLGDSLSYGSGASPETSYPTLLAQHTGWNIINAGVPGDTTAQGLARLPELINDYQPQYLFIELGGNDFIKKVPITQTQKNLTAIITLAKQNNIPTLMIAIPEYQPVAAAFGGLSDHEIYQKLAIEYDIPLIENLFSEVLSDNALKADYVHPNAKGYAVVEQGLREALFELGLLSDNTS